MVIIMNNIQDTLKQRQGSHGDFTDNSQVTEDIMDVIRRCPRYNVCPAYIKTATYMIVHKLARAFCGDPFFDDHWKDIQGYAKITEDRVNETSKNIQ
jgi:hypothetical protein